MSLTTMVRTAVFSFEGLKLGKSLCSNTVGQVRTAVFSFEGLKLDGSESVSISKQSQNGRVFL